MRWCWSSMTYSTCHSRITRAEWTPASGGSSSFAEAVRVVGQWAEDEVGDGDLEWELFGQRSAGRSWSGRPRTGRGGSPVLAGGALGDQGADCVATVDDGLGIGQRPDR